MKFNELNPNQQSFVACLRFDQPLSTAMAAFRRLADTSLLASIRSSHQEATPMPSKHIARRGYHIELGAREKALLEENSALKRFKSYKNNLKLVSRIGDALNVVVVAACTYEI